MLIMCLWTVVLEEILGVPCAERRSNQSILKEINPEYSLEGLVRKLKLQYFGHLMWRVDSLEKNPDARQDWGQEEKGVDRGWNHWMASLTQRTWVGANCRRWWRTGKPGALQSMGSQSWPQLSDWTEWLLKKYRVSHLTQQRLSSFICKVGITVALLQELMRIQRDEAWSLTRSKIGAISSMMSFLAFSLL